MTLRCIRCHRKLTREPQDGMGRVCFAKAGAKPIPAHESDLFGFDIALATEAARELVRIFVAGLSINARIEMGYEFDKARRRLGVWS